MHDPWCLPVARFMSVASGGKLQTGHLHLEAFTTTAPLLPDDRTLSPLRCFIQQAFGATLHLRPSPDPVFDLTLWGPWSHSTVQVQSMIAPLVDATFHEKAPPGHRKVSTGAAAPNHARRP